MANLTKSLVMPNGQEYEFIGRTWFGTCTTAAETQAKTVSITGFTSSNLTNGTRVVIQFNNQQGYNGTPTLNINSTGAKNIFRTLTNSNIVNNITQYEWQAGEIVAFIYYNSYWVIENGGAASAAYWGKTKLTNTISNTSILALTPKAVYDAGYQTATQVNALIGSAIGNITSFETAVVQTLPTTAISANTIYFTPNSGTATNVYDEYMYINSQWEKIGSTDVDLSDIKNDLTGRVTINGTSATFSGIPLSILDNVDLHNTNVFYYKDIGEGSREVQEYKCIRSFWTGQEGTVFIFQGIEYGEIVEIRGSFNTYSDDDDTFTGVVTTYEIPLVTSTYSSTGTDAINGTAVASALSTLSIPTVESTTNVNAMLSSFGLNPTANLQTALAGNAELDHAVVT